MPLQCYRGAGAAVPLQCYLGAGGAAPGRDGQAQGGGRPVNIVMNVTTPDVQGFARSQSQIAAQMARALARGDRNR